MTITIRLDENMDQAVAAAARSIGVSKSEYVRQCLRERLEQEATLTSAWQLGKDVFGKYSSDRRDLSRNAKRLAREKIHARKGRR